MAAGSERTRPARRARCRAPATPRPPQLFIPRPRLDDVPRHGADDAGDPDGRARRLGQDGRGGRVVASACSRAADRCSVTWTRGDQPRPIAAQVEAMRSPEHARRSRGRRHRRRPPAGATRPRDAARRHPVRRSGLGATAADRAARARPGADLGRPRRRRPRAARRRSPLRRGRGRRPGARAPPGRRARTTSLPSLEQADGWAAALVLGSRALAGSADIADARASLAATRQPVLDYLLHEVFETLPGDLTQVLLSDLPAGAGHRRRGRPALRPTGRARRPRPGRGRRSPGDRLTGTARRGLGGLALPPAAARPAAPTYRADRAGLVRRRARPPPSDRGVRRPPRRRARDPARRADRRPRPAAAGAARVRLRADQPASVRGAGRRVLAVDPARHPVAAPRPAGRAGDRAARPGPGSTPPRRPPTGCSPSTPAASHDPVLPRHRGPAGPCWRCGRPGSAGARPGRHWIAPRGCSAAVTTPRSAPTTSPGCHRSRRPG